MAISALLEQAYLYRLHLVLIHRNKASVLQFNAMLVLFQEFMDPHSVSNVRTGSIVFRKEPLIRKYANSGNTEVWLRAVFASNALRVHLAKKEALLLRKIVCLVQKDVSARPKDSGT